MKLHYEAFSPADSTPQKPRERVAQGTLDDVPDDAELPDVLATLERVVERDAKLPTGTQVRVIARRDGEDEPHYWHVWDHGQGLGVDHGN